MWFLGRLGLTASAPVEVESATRFSYFFDVVRVLLGPLGGVSIPLASGPGGWTQAQFLDHDIRIMRNFRRDLLILVRMP